MTFYVLQRTVLLWQGSTPHKDLRTGSDCSLEPETLFTTSQIAAAAQAILFSTSPSPPPSICQLDGTNWQQWSATLEALMRMNGTHHHLTYGALVHADPANPDTAIVVCWEKDAEVLIGLLFLFITTEVYSQIDSNTVFPLVHDKYQHLEVLYGMVGSMATFNLWLSLANAKQGKVGQQCKAAQNTAITENTVDAQTLARLANTLPIGKSTLQSHNLYSTINGSGKIKEVLDAPQVSLYAMSGNTQKPVAWMMDSGASQHFTPYIEDFTTYTQHKGVEISLGDNSIIVTS